MGWLLAMTLLVVDSLLIYWCIYKTFRDNVLSDNFLRTTWNDTNKMSRDVRKPDFCICENKDADQLRGNREADQRLCFATQIVQFLYFLNTKFHTSSHLMRLYSSVSVGPGRKPRRPVFSQRGSNRNAYRRLTQLRLFKHGFNKYAIISSPEPKTHR